MVNRHDAPKTEAELLQKRERVARQVRAVFRGEPVRCGCGWVPPTLSIYRCYYCAEWYCERCAPDHFGGKREAIASVTQSGGHHETRNEACGD